MAGTGARRRARRTTGGRADRRQARSGSSHGAAPPVDLTPFAPRVALDWIRDDPARLWKRVDASMLFVDLSGFTAMSEKLAKLGKEGAEEVTEVINATFVELLSVAYEAGGSLLKFGGDALLLLYTDEGHERRACYAADGMRRTLRRIGRIRTSGGLVQLKMSAGVHSGPFHLFLVGESHRELIVTGPGATATVDMEGAASGGEVMLGPRSAAALEESSLGERRAGGRLLKRAPAAGLQPADVSIEATHEAATLLPVAVRRHVASGGGEGAEHRQVTVCFIHFDHTDHLVSKRPGEAAKRLDGLVRLVQTAADEHGVSFLSTDIDHDGGKIILTAGMPDALGDDEERMLRAVRAIVGGARGIAVRAGVHRGFVFSGTVGPFYRRTYTVMGDAVNTAARVMARAEPGQVLVTPEVLERSRTVFETTELEPFRAKGKSKPIHVHALGEPVGEREGVAHLQTPFVGRARELETLQAAMAGALGGKGRVVRVAGEPGIGKSRLVDEALAGTTSVHRAASRAYASATPYFPFGPILRSALGLPAGDRKATGRALTALVSKQAPALRPWLPLLAIPVDADVAPTREVDLLDENVRPARLREATVDLIARVAGPSVVVFEDADHLDAASTALLEALSKKVSSIPWLVVVAGRDPADLPEAETIVVPPLEGNADHLARVLLAGRAVPEEAAALGRRSGGNPMFLIELASSALAGRPLTDLPESLEAVVATRIDTLAPRDRTTLRVLSVVGTEFDLGLLRAAGLGDADPADLGRTLSEFVDVSAGAIRFRQALFQQVAYEGLPYKRRRAVHEEVGSAIERAGDADRHADILSYHFHAAGRFDRAWTYSLAAARDASSKFARLDACEFYERAIDAGRRGAIRRNELAQANLEFGEQLHWAGRLPAAVDAFRAGRRHAADVSLQARLHQREGGVCMRLGRFADAARLYGRGLAAVDRSGDLKERWRLSGAYAALRYHQGRYAIAKRMALRAVDDARRSRERAGLAHAYNTLSLCCIATKDPQGTVYAERALELFGELGLSQFQGQTLNNLGLEAYENGEWDRALEFYERARVSTQASGNTLGASAVAANIAIVRAEQGRIEEAEAALRDTYDAFTASGTRQYALLILRLLGRSAAMRGEYATALQLIGDAERGYVELGMKGHTCEAFRAAVWFGMGDLERAGAEADRIAEEAAPQLLALVERLAGRIADRLGRPDEAITRHRRSLQAAAAAKSDYEAAQTHQALSEVPTLDPETAEHHAALARNLLERMGIQRIWV